MANPPPPSASFPAMHLRAGYGDTAVLTQAELDAACALLVATDAAGGNTQQLGSVRIGPNAWVSGDSANDLWITNNAYLSGGLWYAATITDASFALVVRQSGVSVWSAPAMDGALAWTQVTNINGAGLPVATALSRGVVAVDGVTIGVNGNGVIAVLTGPVSGVAAYADPRIVNAEQIANKNQPNGYAGLDGGGKVLASVIPASAIPAAYVASGTWNASSNTPTLASGVGTAGHVYVVSAAGTTSLDGNASWSVGDWALFGADSVWHRIPSFVGFQPTAAATLTALRALSGTVDGQIVQTLGGVAAGDGFADTWEWNASSTAVDDGLTCVKGVPTTGRFLSVTFARRTHPQQLANLLSTIDNKVAQGLPAIVRVIGDSTTAFEYTWMRNLMAALKGRYGDAGNLTTWLGDYNVSAFASGQPWPPILQTGQAPVGQNADGPLGWQQQGFCGLGLRRAVGVNGTATDWTIQSPQPCTEIRVYYSLESGAGSVNWTIDGVSQTAINCSGSQAFGQEVIVSGLTYGNHTVKFTAPTGSPVYLERIKWNNNRPGIDFEESLISSTGLFDYAIARPISGGLYMPFGWNQAPVAVIGHNGLDAVLGNNGATKPDFIILSPMSANDVHLITAGFGSTYYTFTGGSGTNYDTTARYVASTLLALDVPALIVHEFGGWFQHAANASYQSGMWQQIRGLWHQLCASLTTVHAGLVDLDSLLDSSAADIVAYSQQFNGTLTYGDNPPSDVTTGSAGATWWIHPIRRLHQRAASEILRQLGLPSPRGSFDAAAVYADAKAPNAILQPGYAAGPIDGVGAQQLEMLTAEGRPRKCYTMGERALTIGGQWRTLWRSEDGLANWDATGDFMGVQSGGAAWQSHGTDQWGTWSTPAPTGTGSYAAPVWNPPNYGSSYFPFTPNSFNSSDGNPFTVCIVVSGQGFAWLGGYDGGASHFGKAIRMVVDGLDTGIDSTLSSGAVLNEQGVVFFDCPRPTVVFLTGKNTVGTTNGWILASVQSAYTNPSTTNGSAKVYGSWITRTSFPVRVKDTISQTRYAGPSVAVSVDPPAANLVIGQEFLETVNSNSVQKLCTGLDVMKINDATQYYGQYSVLNKSAVNYWRADTPDSPGTWTLSADLADFGGSAAFNASLANGAATIELSAQGSAIAFPISKTFTLSSRQKISSTFTTAGYSVYFCFDDLGGNRNFLNPDGTWSLETGSTLGTPLWSSANGGAVYQGRTAGIHFTTPGSIPGGMGSTIKMRLLITLTVATGQGPSIPIGPFTVVDGHSACA